MKMEVWMLRHAAVAIMLLLLLSLAVVVAVYAVQPAAAASGGPEYVCERCALLAYRTVCQGCRANATRPHRIYEIYRCCDYCYGGGCQIVQFSKCISYC